jgi:hypothetical protein
MGIHYTFKFWPGQEEFGGQKKCFMGLFLNNHKIHIFPFKIISLFHSLVFFEQLWFSLKIYFLNGSHNIYSGELSYFS